MCGADWVWDRGGPLVGYPLVHLSCYVSGLLNMSRARTAQKFTRLAV